MLTPMEFQQVVNQRVMVRAFTQQRVDPQVIQRAIHNATRAPNAGFTQGWGFLLLDTAADRHRWWATTASPQQLAAPNAWLRGMMSAPVLILPCSSEAAYRHRYAEPDKGRAELPWDVPYWHMDTAMAALLILLTAVDAGLGGCYFGLPGGKTAAVKHEFGIPDQFHPIGVIALGYPAPGGNAGSPSRRRRKPLAEVLHHGNWGQAWDQPAAR